MGQGTATSAPPGDRVLAGQVRVRRACILGLAILVDVVVLTATARCTNGDAMGLLLVSEQIRQDGTIALDTCGLIP